MKIQILEQPDDVTCGPTSLHAVYDYLNHKISLQRIIDDVHYLKDGGTLAVSLGVDAIERGFNAYIYSYNLRIFDPSWIQLDSPELLYKLKEQLKYKKSHKMHEATAAYMKFINKGGKILFGDLSKELLKQYLDQNLPILSGLSATYLYNAPREYTVQNRSYYDDLKGYPVGHFVVIYGINEMDLVNIADPYKGNPISRNNYYQVPVNKLLNAIMLGIVTYDANLLIISRKEAHNEKDYSGQ